MYQPGVGKITDQVQDKWEHYNEIRNVTLPAEARRQYQSGELTLDTDYTVRRGFQNFGFDPQDEVDHVFDWFRRDYDSAQTAEKTSVYFSMTGSSRFGGIEYFVTDERGFDMVVKLVADEYLEENDPRLVLNSKVDTIAYTSTGVRCILENGDVYTADYMVLTVSLGVLHHEMIRFDPPLPDWKKYSLSGAVFNTFNKVFLKFPYSFWNEDINFNLIATEEKGLYSLWRPLHEGVMFSVIVDEHAKRMETQSEEEVKAEVMEVLRSAYGDDIPEIEDIHRTMWFSNPLTRGSYINYQFETSNRLCESCDFWDPVERIYFGGSAFSSHPGFVHGGMNGGEYTANWVITDMEREGLIE